MSLPRPSPYRSPPSFPTRRSSDLLSQGHLEALDVENLRPHYARTLWAWSDGLEQQLDAARQILTGAQGERSLRAYRLYLAGCAMGVEQGWISLHQVLAQHDVVKEVGGAHV